MSETATDESLILPPRGAYYVDSIEEGHWARPEPWEIDDSYMDLDEFYARLGEFVTLQADADIAANTEELKIEDHIL